MAEFQNFDLGRVLQTAEVIKGMRREGENDRVRNMYMGEQVATMQANRPIHQAQEARAATQFSQEQQVTHTKLLNAAAAEMMKNGAAAERWIPELQQAGIIKPDMDWRSIPPEQWQEKAADLFEQTQAALTALVPEKAANNEPLETIIGPDGKPVLARRSESVGKTPYERPRGAGITMTTPDGTEVQVGGDGVPNYGGVNLSKPTRTKLEDAFTNAQANSFALREQMAKYKPEFSTFAGRFKAGLAEGKEMLGMDNAPQQTQYLQEFTSWKSDTLRLLSQYLNQLSGAAISPHEEVRLKGGFPNTEDSPTVYKAKAESTMRQFALAQARAAYLLSNPSQSLDSVSLDKMSGIIVGEANKLAAALEKGGMDAEKAKATAIQETKNRFGMGDGQ